MKFNFCLKLFTFKLTIISLINVQCIWASNNNPSSEVELQSARDQQSDVSIANRGMINEKEVLKKLKSDLEKRRDSKSGSLTELAEHKNSKKENELDFDAISEQQNSENKPATKIAPDSQELVFFNYQEIPVSALIRQIFSFVNKDAIGINKLDDLTVSLNVKDVLPLDVASVVLKCNGFKMSKDGDYLKIVKDPFLADRIGFGDEHAKFDTNACVERHLK